MSGRKLLLYLSLFICASTLTTERRLVAQQKPSFTVGWSVYVGWNPYYYMAKSGILRKWADKYGINIKVQRFDYAPSLDAFVAKNIDACAMTNMEALDMPAAAGVDTTAIIVGDYSNGNDAVITSSEPRAGADSRQAGAAGREDRFAISVRARHGDERAGDPDQARSSTSTLRIPTLPPRF